MSDGGFAADWSVGQAAARRMAQVRGLIADMRDPSDPDHDAAMQSTLQRLDTASATISVVGQVKAGKSSLINALIARADLLPTEVNPWTAVITNLHCGHADKPTEGGVFELFSEAEWHQMIDGNSESRALAEEFLPGFSSDKLRAQIIEMQDSARNRLGDFYGLLLGKKHRFNTITPEILEKYVSAGHSDDPAQLTGAGRFSGITKSADVFLPAGPFRVPLTLSDTPGINDPFLVRDEITTSSFRRADIFVVALSAHQPLNAADLALVRMLSRHSGKRMVIFVNRIDQLENPAAEGPALVADLDARLRDVLAQDAGLVVIAGSAHWGMIATSGSDADVAAALQDPAARACAGEIGTTGLHDRAALRRASGLDALGAALDEAMISAWLPAVTTQIAAVANATATLRAASLAERLTREETLLVNADALGSLAEAECGRIAQRRAVLAHLASSLQTAERAGEAALNENAETVFKTLSNTLEESLARFVEDQVAQLRAQLDAGGGAQEWQVDTALLRESIDARLSLAFRAGRTQLDRLLQRHGETLAQAMIPLTGATPIADILSGLPNEEFLPAFKPRSTLLQVPLATDRGWKFWKSRALGPNEACAAISRVIRSELFPAMAEVNASVLDALGARNAAAQERLRGMLRHAIALASQEDTALEQQHALFEGDIGPEQVRGIVEGRRRQAQDLRQRLQALNDARAALLARFGSDHGPGAELVPGRSDAAG